MSIKINVSNCFATLQCNRYFRPVCDCKFATTIQRIGKKALNAIKEAFQKISKRFKQTFCHIKIKKQSQIDTIDENKVTGSQIIAPEALKANKEADDKHNKVIIVNKLMLSTVALGKESNKTENYPLHPEMPLHLKALFVEPGQEDSVSEAPQIEQNSHVSPDDPLNVDHEKLLPETVTDFAVNLFESVPEEEQHIPNQEDDSDDEYLMYLATQAQNLKIELNSASSSQSDTEDEHS